MKTIIGLLALIVIYNCAYADLPPVRAAGQGGVLAPAFNIYTAPNQVTKIGAVSQLLELGNDNLLANPDFEHATAGQSWTSGAGTLSNQTTGQAKGSQALKIALAAQTLNISQTVSTHSSLAGNQAEAVIWAKSTTSTSGGALLFGSKIDGTESAVSVPVVLTSNWQRLSIPFVSGSTSQGLFLKSTTGITNDIFVDNAYVKMGEVKNTSSVVSSWQSYTPTFTGFGTVTTSNIKWRQVGSSIEISGTYISGTPTATEARISLPNSYTALSSLPTLSLAGGTLGNTDYVGRSSSPLIEPNVSYLTFNYFEGATSFLVKRDGNAITNTGTVVAIYATVPVNELSGNVSTYSQGADYSWTDSGITPATAGWQGFGTIASVNIQKSRIGGNLYLRGKFVQGTPTATEFRIPLPDGLTIKSGYVAGMPMGDFAFNAVLSSSQNQYVGSSASGNGYLNLYLQSSASGYSIINTTGPMPSAGAEYQITVGPIPITGWDAGLITGSFKNVLTASSTPTPWIESGSFTDSSGIGFSNWCTTSNCTLTRKIGSKVTNIDVTTAGTAGVSITFDNSVTMANVSCLVTAHVQGSLPFQACPMSSTSGQIMLNECYNGGNKRGSYICTGY